MTPKIKAIGCKDTGHHFYLTHLCVKTVEYDMNKFLHVKIVSFFSQIDVFVETNNIVCCAVA